MKKKLLAFVFVLFSIPLFAQMRNGANAALVSWTKDGAETGMTDKVTNAVIQLDGNNVQYTLQVRGEDPVVFKFNRLTKRLHVERSGKLVLSTLAGYAESGSNSNLSYTDENNAAHVLKFRRK
ncbi:MAG: hypothetical protein LBI86_02465 [Treponema sp.]|jgi:hypothetical protein|nr:hypothetical protein [Treponema sp.]